MAALTVVAIRQRIATALAALSGWSESRFAPTRFGRDAAQLVHRSFSVEPSTPASPLAADRRQRRSRGVELVSPIVVRYAHRLRADAQVADYDAALADEATAIKTVLGVSRADLHLILDSVSTREVSADGAWFLGSLRFNAIHTLALE